MAETWSLIANPAAGRGRARTAAQRGKALLEQAGRTVDLHFTSAPGHGAELASSAVSDGVGAVVVCGGDGTVSEISQVLAGTAVPLGLLPFGTANDFARALDIPRRLPAAVSHLVSGTPAPVDLAAVGQRCFCTVAALGLDAEVSHAMSAGRARWRGTAGYVEAAVRLLPRFQPPSVHLSGDFGDIDGRYLIVATGNTRNYGGGIPIAPEADLRDGLLDVCLISPISLWTALALLPRLFLGRHVRHPAVRVERSSWLQIDTPEPLLMYADGEYLTHTPARIEARPGALSVIQTTANP